MEKNLFQGELVRLSIEDPETQSVVHARWGRDSEYLRLLDSDSASMWSAKKFKEWFDEELKKDSFNQITFHIHTLEDDRLIGFIGLGDIEWNNGDAWVGIGIGEREYWGKGYGTDAMRTLLRYAFTELNLHRINLGAFVYNPRAIRSYEKAGFTVEGYEREALHRDGNYTDSIYMGILREEWQARNA